MDLLTENMLQLEQCVLSLIVILQGKSLWGQCCVW